MSDLVYRLRAAIAGQPVSIPESGFSATIQSQTVVQALLTEAANRIEEVENSESRMARRALEEGIDWLKEDRDEWKARALAAELHGPQARQAVLAADAGHAALGFHPKALGEDGPAAQAEALKLYAAWQAPSADRGKSSPATRRDVRAYFDRFRRTTTWQKKAPRTREDYERAWKHIDAWRPAPAADALAHGHHQDHARTTARVRRPPRKDRLAERAASHHQVAEGAAGRRRGAPAAGLRLAGRQAGQPAAQGPLAIWLGAEIEGWRPAPPSRNSKA
jgi:hypothetical protein